MDNQIVININRLGPVRDAKITLGQFMIFSGASGLGKSYTAMLVHYVYRIFSGEELNGFFKEKQVSFGDVSRFTDTDLHDIFICKSSDLVKWINNRAKEYLIDMLAYPQLDIDINIEFPSLPQNIHFNYAHVEQVEQDNPQLPNLAPRGRLGISPSGPYTSFPLSMLPQANSTLFANALSTYLAFRYGMRFIISTFLIPPSRGAIMQIPQDKQLNVFSSTPMYKEFLEVLANIRSYKNIESSSINTRLIAEGRLEDNEGELVYNYHDIPIPISATASSIKEIAPFVMMAEKGLSRYYATLFEEPESHLHPELQEAVVDVMAQMVQQGTHLQITTHSDYVLRRINDLIYLYKLKESWANDEKFSDFCNEKGIDYRVTLNPHIIKAYFFKPEEEGLASVQEQDISDGVPFDTFATVIDKKFPISVDIYEQFQLSKK